MDSGMLVLLVSVGILFFAYLMYAKMIRLKNNAKEALSGIDVQLKKRSNLLPNILKIAERYMKHESETFTQVAALRANADKEYDVADMQAVKQHFTDIAKLDAGLGKFMIQVEDYPDLKADSQMLKAQMTYNEVEEHIAASRRFYNATVKELNSYIEIFPGNLIAPFAHATMLPFYEADELSRAPVDASDFLKYTNHQ